MSIDRDVSANRNGPQPAREAAREIMSGNAVRSSGSRYSRFLARCTVVISERIAQLGTNNSASKWDRDVREVAGTREESAWLFISYANLYLQFPCTVCIVFKQELEIEILITDFLGQFFKTIIFVTVFKY